MASVPETPGRGIIHDARQMPVQMDARIFRGNSASIAVRAIDEDLDLDDR